MEYVVSMHGRRANKLRTVKARCLPFPPFFFSFPFSLHHILIILIIFNCRSSFLLLHLAGDR